MMNDDMVCPTLGLELRALCNQSFLNENACSGDESRAKVLFEYPITTFINTKP